MRTAQAAKIADEARLVVIAQIKQIIWKIRFDSNVMDFYNSEFINPNQCPSDSLLNVAMADGYPQ